MSTSKTKGKFEKLTQADEHTESATHPAGMTLLQAHEGEGDVSPAYVMAAVQSATPDTIVIPDEWLEKQEQLTARYLSMGANPFSAVDEDSAGRENIVGVGVGLRKATGVYTGELAVKVFVRTKLPLARVSAQMAVPPEEDGFPTDVEEVGEIMPLGFNTKYALPVPCGVTCSNKALPGSGTLGCLVQLNNGKLCVLGNNHVLANENQGVIGQMIIQPGNAEPMYAKDKIGLLENFIRLNSTQTGMANTVDAAVAWTRFNWIKPEHVTYTINPTPVAATIGMSVVKNGRTTGATSGTVVARSNVEVPYALGGFNALFKNQLVINGSSGLFSNRGDSGALVATLGTKQPVGLLFAGSSSGATYANPIDEVIKAFGITRFIAAVEA